MRKRRKIWNERTWRDEPSIAELVDGVRVQLLIECVETHDEQVLDYCENHCQLVGGQSLDDAVGDGPDSEESV